MKEEPIVKGAISTIHAQLDGFKKGVKYNFDEHLIDAIDKVILVYSSDIAEDLKDWIEKESLVIATRFKQELIDNESLSNEERRKYFRMRRPLIPICNKNFD